MADIGRALGMRTIAHDPFVTSAATDGPELVGLDELWACADALTPPRGSATPSTYRIVDRSALVAMPLGSFLVNSARGTLADHQALLDALDAGELAAAGLDVTDPEPLPEGHPLLTHPR